MSPSTRRWQLSVKTALASTIFQTLGQPPLRERAPRRRPLILGYHRVVECFEHSAVTNIPSMLTSAGMFEHHLEWLGRRFRFVSLDEIAARAATGVPFAEPVVALTFDDGYQDVYEHAFPLMKRRGIPGAVFVITDLVGTTHWQTHDRLYHLLQRAFAAWRAPRFELRAVLGRLDIPADPLLSSRSTSRSVFNTVAALLAGLTGGELDRLMRHLEGLLGCDGAAAPALMTWDTIREMRRAGFTVGSHTRTHASLPAESPACVADQLAGSKRAIECRLGEVIAHFAYPGGQFTPGVVQQVVDTGYTCAYTACSHGDARWPSATMERLLLSEGSSVDADGRFSPSVLGCQVFDLWPPAWRCERTHRA